MAEETETRISTAQVEKAVGAIQYLSSLKLSAPTSQGDSNGSGSAAGSSKPGTLKLQYTVATTPCYLKFGYPLLQLKPFSIVCKPAIYCVSNQCVCSF